MKIAVYGLKTSSEHKKYFKKFFKVLEKKSAEIIIEKKFKILLEKEFQCLPGAFQTFSGYGDLPEDTDFLFTFGGDGTILDAAAVVQDKNIKILGVNTGRLGFLAATNVEFLFEILDDVLEGSYFVSPRSLIEVESDEVKFSFPFALNEVSVTRRETTSMITVDAYVNGEILNAYWADGLIIATPTGSTGYSLSCGGPIVHPKNEVFIVTAISPHNLNVRPYIITDDSELELKISSREGEYFLSLDSRNKPLPSNVRLKLKKAPFKLQLVVPQDITYLKTLRDKMFWGSDKRN